MISVRAPGDASLEAPASFGEELKKLGAARRDLRVLLFHINRCGRDPERAPPTYARAAVSG
jgi:hypothetical protein